MTYQATCSDLMPGSGTPLVKSILCNRVGNHGGAHENGLWRWPQAPTERYRRPIIVGPVDPRMDWVVPTWC